MSEGYGYDEFWLTAGTFMLDHLWQTTLFAAITMAVVFLLRRAPARTRYAVWTIALLKFLFPSAMFIYLGKLAGLDATSFLASIAWASGDPLGFVNRQQEIFLVADSWSNALNHPSILFSGVACIWVFGSVAFLLIWGIRQARLFRQIHHGEVLTSGREFDILHQLRSRLGIRKEIQLIRHDQMTEPGVWGIRHPKIVISGQTSSRLSHTELEAVLTHELAHIARSDNLFSVLHRIICSVFWFHPAVWWIERQLLAERERACDDRVIECGSNSKDYAASLVKVLRAGLSLRMAGLSCAGGSDLKRRILHITSGERRKTLRSFHWIVLITFITAAGVLLVASANIDECEKSTWEQQLAHE